MRNTSRSEINFIRFINFYKSQMAFIRISIRLLKSYLLTLLTITY